MLIYIYVYQTKTHKQFNINAYFDWNCRTLTRVYRISPTWQKKSKLHLPCKCQCKIMVITAISDHHTHFSKFNNLIISFFFLPCLQPKRFRRNKQNVQSKKSNQWKLMRWLVIPSFCKVFWKTCPALIHNQRRFVMPSVHWTKTKMQRRIHQTINRKSNYARSIFFFSHSINCKCTASHSNIYIHYASDKKPARITISKKQNLSIQN